MRGLAQLRGLEETIVKRELAGDICTVLSLMHGFPPWQGETGEALDERYMIALLPLPDDLGQRIRAEVDRTFEDRPGVKALLDWAASLAPRKTFDIRDLDKPLDRPALDGPSPNSAPRLTGSLNGPKPDLPAYGAGIVAAGAPPPVVREMMRRLKARAGQPAVDDRCGLQFRDRKTGTIQRTGLGMSRAAAEAKAAERNEKWPHIETTVYTADDPPPPGRSPDIASQTDPAASLQMSAETVPEMAEAT